MKIEIITQEFTINPKDELCGTIKKAESTVV